MPRRPRSDNSNARGDVIHVPDDEDGKTLAAVLKRALKLSWGEAEVRIMNRHVAVHGNLCLDPARRLKKGDVINLLDQAAEKPPEPEDLSVLFSDRHLVVVDKPAGLVSAREPRESGMSAKRRERQPTLNELLDKRFRRPHDRGNAIFAVHRLDRDTSGLMLFARTPDAEASLVSMFQAHDLQRAYLAVTLNGPPPSRVVDTLITRDRGDGKRGSLRSGQTAADAKRALTRVEPAGHLSRNRGLADCALETGRTHQIRIHLSEIGHPVCGDKIYGDRNETDPPPRQALHARRLAFDHPINRRPMEFESGWPRDIERWLSGRNH